tara:strand:- start:316 stop:522 length:207 start_codon:yes stop_codon:yes gene_type:complete
VIDEMRFLALRSALKLELLGMKRSRSPSAYVLLKRDYGLKGNRDKVLKQANEIRDAMLKEIHSSHLLT